MTALARTLGVGLTLALTLSAVGACGDDASTAPPDPCDALTCGANAECVTAASGAAACECLTGFTGDGTTCTADAVDECAAGTDNCDANATCTDTATSFTCACNDGYSGDGVTCTPGAVDECAAGTDNCDANATCTDTATSFTCACNDGFTGDGVTCTADVEAKTWTVFVYGQADSNISADLADNIQEMAKATLSDDITVIVMVDWNSSLPNRFDPSCADGTSACPNLPERTQWFKIRGNNQDAELLKTTDEIDSTDPEELSAAVAEVFTTYPADRYAVMLWNHGGSWDGGYGVDNDDGNLADGTSMTHLEATDAVRAGMTAAGITGPRPLSFFFFDTCLMGNVEVAYQARELAHVYFGNAEVDFGAGLNYRDILSTLSATPGAPLNELAASEVIGWGVRHKSKGISDELLRSHVALDTSKMDAFAAAMEAFTDAALADWANVGDEMARFAYDARPAFSVELSSGEPSESYRDVGQFLTFFEDSVHTDLAAKAAAAKAALAELVIANDAGELRLGAGQSGLSIALPIPQSFTSDVATSYDTLASAWSTDTGWGAVLGAFKPTDGEEPTATTTLTNGDAPDADHLPTVTVAAGATAAEVVIEVAEFVTNERWLTYGVLGVYPIDAATGEVTASWDLQLAALTDGAGGEQAVTLRRFVPGGFDGSGAATPGLELVPGMCDFGDGDQNCDLVVRTDTWETISVLDRYEPEQPVSYDLSEVAGYFPGATFTPYLDATDQAGAPVEPEPGAAFLFPESGTLSLSRMDAPTAIYSIVTNVFDYYGQRLTLFDDFTY
jgi:hypothetical protein